MPSQQKVGLSTSREFLLPPIRWSAVRCITPLTQQVQGRKQTAESTITAMCYVWGKFLWSISYTDVETAILRVLSLRLMHPGNIRKTVSTLSSISAFAVLLGRIISWKEQFCNWRGVTQASRCLEQGTQVNGRKKRDYQVRHLAPKPSCNNSCQRSWSQQLRCRAVPYTCCVISQIPLA